MILTMTFAPCMLNSVSAKIELSELEGVSQIKVVQEGRSITVYGAQGKTVCIYNLIGINVMTIHVESQCQRIELNSLTRGVYPVRVGNVTKKIQIN